MATLWSPCFLLEILYLFLFLVFLDCLRARFQTSSTYVSGDLKRNSMRPRRYATR